MAHTVGAAAKAVGVSAKAIRIWEAKGLLPAAGRTEAGWRLYSDDDIGILRFIAQAKTLGLTLPEIKGILDLHRQGAAPRSSRYSTRTSATLTGQSRSSARYAPAWRR